MKFSFATFFLSFLCLFTLFIFIACKKSDAGSSFTWTYKGVNYAASKSRAIPASNGLYTIEATTIGAMPDVQTGVLPLTVGQYKIPDTAGIGYFERTTGNIYPADSGIINITSKSSNSVSGNFSAILNNGEALTGTFSNVPIQ